MCGITGFSFSQGAAEPEVSKILVRMVDALTHRGPDDSGQWLDPGAGIALGNRRLAVIDLSASGHQPMESESGRFVLVYNGEIYNHLELRERLGRRIWRGHSDTETLLAGIEEWGLEATLRLCTGMFALALWDRRSRTLSLARDRMGEKPMYYGWQGRTFLFGSELKPLCQHPDFHGDIDRDALREYVRHGYVPAPRSIYSGICKLPPASVVTVKLTETALPRPARYWSIDEVLSTSRPFGGNAEDAVALLEGVLLAAVKRQQITDVPLGALLSGGTDSSTVVSLMQASSARPTKTFSIGFEEGSYDEAAHARAVAAHLGCEHTQLYVSGEDALQVVPDLPTIYDEPFADPSQIPTVLVARLARRHVTVALSGDGGDEVFCGYGRYAQTLKTWRQLSLLPPAARTALSWILPEGAMREGVAAPDLDRFYQFTNAQWKGYPRLVAGAEAGYTPVSVPAELHDPLERMMYADTARYLPDDILVKVDRAAMSASLETRAPLLDHHVVEFAWSLPSAIRQRGGIAKWPLKQVLYKYVPRPLVDRPKKGFGAPIDAWLRGSLRDWSEELLSDARLKSEGHFDPLAVRGEWRVHLSGKRNRHYGLWTILMFQAWCAHTRHLTRAGAASSSAGGRDGEVRCRGSAISRAVAGRAGQA